MNWKKKLAAWVEDEQVGEWLFFLAFAVYLGLWVWLTTLYPLSSLASKICKLLFIGLIGLRILVYCRYRVPLNKYPFCIDIDYKSPKFITHQH